MSVEVYLRGSTVEIWSYNRDWDGNYSSPDQGVKVTITNPSGTVKVDAQAMTEDATGKFVYRYNSASDDEAGSWTYECVGQNGTGDSAKYTRKDGGFELK